jgi:hypothetical protein
MSVPVATVAPTARAATACDCSVSRRFTMTDEPYWTPNLKPAPVRLGKPGEQLFEFRKGVDCYSCELRDHGEWASRRRSCSTGISTSRARFRSSQTSASAAETWRSHGRGRSGRRWRNGRSEATDPVRDAAPALPGRLGRTASECRRPVRCRSLQAPSPRIDGHRSLAADG